MSSNTMTVHVRYNSWYISFPYSAKQQREMTKFCVLRRTRIATENFLIFISNFALGSKFSFVVTKRMSEVNEFIVSRDSYFK